PSRHRASGHQRPRGSGTEVFRQRPAAEAEFPPPPRHIAPRIRPGPDRSLPPAPDTTARLPRRPGPPRLSGEPAVSGGRAASPAPCGVAGKRGTLHLAAARGRRTGPQQVFSRRMGAAALSGAWSFTAPGAFIILSSPPNQFWVS